VLAVEDLHFHFSELIADFMMTAVLGFSTGGLKGACFLN
jgi:hypothetical protein